MTVVTCREFGLQNGTTYNSYIIDAEKLTVVDASHEKFRGLYLSALKEQIDPSTIQYIVANHTEPDHSGLIPDLLELSPNAIVLGSKICIQFLQNLIHKPFKSQIVKVTTLNKYERTLSMRCCHEAASLVFRCPLILWVFTTLFHIGRVCMNIFISI